MISDSDLYLEKAAQDPWSQIRASQKIRREIYMKQLRSFFGDGVFSSAIDLACGCGELSQQLSAFSDRLLLADYSVATLNLCKVNTNHQYSYRFNQLPDISFDEKYDLVYAIEVLNYLNESELEEFFNNVKRIMHPQSYLVVTINKNIFMKLSHDFAIRAIYPRYIPPLDVSHLFHRLERLLDRCKQYLFYKKEKDRLYVIGLNKRVTLPVWLIYLLTFFYPIKAICPLVYKSQLIAQLEYLIGCKLGWKHERELYILSLP